LGAAARLRPGLFSIEKKGVAPERKGDEPRRRGMSSGPVPSRLVVPGASSAPAGVPDGRRIL